LKNNGSVITLGDSFLKKYYSYYDYTNNIAGLALDSQKAPIITSST